MTAYQLTLKHPEWFKGALLMAPALMPSMQHARTINLLRNFLEFLQIFIPDHTKIIKPDLETLCRCSFAL
jgi:hypothetical protein